MNKGLKNPMASVFKYFAISILFCLVGFIVGVKIVPESVVYIANKLIFVLMILFLILCIFSRKRRIPSSFSMNWVYLFTFIDGILIYPIVQYYMSSLGTWMVINIFLGTMLIFLVLSMIATTSKDGQFLGLGKILFISILVLLPLSIINMFIGASILTIATSVLGIIIFSAYILYDVSAVKNSIRMGYINTRDDLSIHVLNLYLDFINIFLDLLRLVKEIND